MQILEARYDSRGTAPHTRIRAVSATLGPLAPGHARVQVLAAPVNPSDVLAITGEYGVLPPLPAVAGGEGVGRVVALGDGAEGPRPGTRVLLPVGCGTWRSHLDVPAAALVPIPDEGDPLQLAMAAVNPPTALLLLSEFVDLAAGDRVIQNAANSAVGHYVVQAAALRGIDAIGVVRRESAAAAVRAAGATHVVVDADDLPRRVRDVAGDGPVRLAIDAVAGPATERLARCLFDGGTVVNYGAMGGEPCQLSPRSLVFRDITLRGFWLARWLRVASPERRRALLQEAVAHVAAGRLHAPVQATFPLERVAEAVEAAAHMARDGKILLVPAT